MKIGFIGLGTMGSRMAANLLKHGYNLVVFNRTREKAGTLVNDGATSADSPAAVAAQVDVLFTMLAHPQAVEEAALGPDGFLSHLSPGRLWVDCSTVNPSFSREMAMQAQAQHIRFLGAPVTGSKNPAALGKLIFWVGGDAEGPEASRPILDCMGDRIVHCGGQGAGAAMKMVANQMLGTGMAAFAEGMVLGESLGLSRKILLEGLLGGPVVAPFLSLKRERIESGNYEQADFTLRWLQKDLHLASVSAYETGVAMPLANVTKEIYRLAIRDGRGEEDFSVIYDYFDRGHAANPAGNSNPGPADALTKQTRSKAYAEQH